jgi:hypothetical protein
LSNMCRRQAKARQPLTAWCPTQRPQGQRKGYRLATERLAATLDKTLGSLMLETKQGHLAEPVPMCAHGGSQNNLTDLKANRRRTFLQAAYVFTQSTLVFFFFITPRKDLERPLNLLKHVLAFLPKAKSSRKQTRSQSEQLELCAKQTTTCACLSSERTRLPHNGRHARGSDLKGASRNQEPSTLDDGS